MLPPPMLGKYFSYKFFLNWCIPHKNKKCNDKGQAIIVSCARLVGQREGERERNLQPTQALIANLPGLAA